MENLLKISLSISLIGILLLLFLTNTIQPRLKDINKIDNKSLNKKIQVGGQITNIKTYEDSNFQILTIKDETGQIDVTLDEILDLTGIKQIEVTGTITEYRGKLQVQADKIIFSP